jgi:hypothetical protein
LSVRSSMVLPIPKLVSYYTPAAAYVSGDFRNG